MGLFAVDGTGECAGAVVQASPHPANVTPGTTSRLQHDSLHYSLLRKHDTTKDDPQ
jgi:hypothetical protein